MSETLHDELLQSTRTKKNYANEIVSLSKNKAFKLPFDFTVVYASKLEYSFEKNELEFLKLRSPLQSSFENVEAVIREKGSLETVIRKLIDCGLFLSDSKYRPIFYAERFASILHSWSRLVLYGDTEEIKQVGEKCIFMSNLSNMVNIECKKSCGVPLLAEKLSKTAGSIPILLKLKKPQKDLYMALLTCKKAMHEQEVEDMFENGKLKEVYGPSHVTFRVNLLRYIVRINARLHKGASVEAVKEADKMCDTLFELSVKHANAIPACLMCLIYCAKYHAAKKDFDRAIKCFQKYFSLELEYNPRFSIRCWATLNYARAVNAHTKQLLDQNLTEKRLSMTQHKNQAVKRCHDALESKDVINKSLKKRLKTLEQQLK